MQFVMRNEFKIAFKKANIVLENLNYDPNKSEMIRTADIIEVVENILNIDVKFTTFDFKSFSKKRRNNIALESFGGAMCVSDNNGQREAIILLNENQTPEMQRFSLVHELGHLMIQDLNNINGYKISTHIDMDITSIPDEVLNDTKNEFLIEEQQANIFSLLVLIPYDMLKKVLLQIDSLEEIARFFGVEKQAIISRIELGRTALEDCNG